MVEALYADQRIETRLVEGTQQFGFKIRRSIQQRCDKHISGHAADSIKVKVYWGLMRHLGEAYYTNHFAWFVLQLPGELNLLTPGLTGIALKPQKS